jgi:hypothetical protein
MSVTTMRWYNPTSRAEEEVPAPMSRGNANVLLASATRTRLFICALRLTFLRRIKDTLASYSAIPTLRCLL